MEYTKTILIGGSGRSGTNILKKILGTHSEIATLPFEHRFTIDPRGVVNFIRTYPASWSPFWPDYKINDLISYLIELGAQDDQKAMRADQAKTIDPVGTAVSPPTYAGWELARWIPDYFSHVENLKKSLVGFEYNAVWPGTPEGIKKNKMLFAPQLSTEELIKIFQPFIERITASIVKSQNKKTFVEDNTYNMLFAKELFQIMPNSKLIHVIRDPRDVIASLKNQRWTPTQLYQLVDWYNEVIKQWEFQREKLDKDRYIEIHFEDLISAPERVLHQICQFIDITLDPAMLEVDLSRHNIGRWKEDDELKTFDFSGLKGYGLLN